ncbi:MAG: ABC transporter substrate-binding protein [Candidatus Hodarchaeota archaeon]
MKRLGILCFIGVLVITFISVISFTAYASGLKPTRGGTLTVGWMAQCKTLDPHKSVQLPERYVLYCIFDTLVGLDPSFKIVPELAVSWENPDPKSYVFHLRRGVKFHDGTDFDASVVKWNMKRILDPDFASPQRKLIEAYLESVEVLDKYTVAFRLKKPYAPLLAALAERPGFMVSPTAVEKYGNKKFALNPVGTGPFKFESWMPQAQLTITRFDDYWGKEEGKPYLDKIVFKEIPDVVVRLTMLRAGTVDIVTEVLPKQAVEIEKEGKLKLVEMPPARWRAMQWQVDKPPFNNHALRQAVAYGIDREAINEALFYGQCIPASGPVVPGLWWYEKEFKGYTYNPELAKKKLVEAGFRDGFSYKYTVPNRQIDVRLAEIMQSQLAKVGIKMEFKMVNASEAYSRLVSGQDNWSHTRWTQRADPHGLLYILFHSQGHANSTKYNNPRVDKLLEEGASIYDRSKRVKIYHEAVRIITMDAPYVFILYFPEWAAMSPNVHGFEWIPDLIPRYSFLWKDK